MDNLRAEYSALHTRIQKSFDDCDRGVAEVIWKQVHAAFGRAFEYQTKADEAMARGNVYDQFYFAAMAILMADMAREIAKIIEQIPSVREAIR